MVDQLAGDRPDQGPVLCSRFNGLAAPPLMVLIILIANNGK